MEAEKFSLKFKAIEILSKATFPEPQGFDGSYFSFDFAFETRGHIEQKLLFAIANVTIRDTSRDTKLAHFATACIFDVPDFENLKFNDQGLLIIPPGLDLILKSASVSTTRGIIFAELRGSYLHNAIMPLINLDELINQSQEKKTENVSK